MEVAVRILARAHTREQHSTHGRMCKCMNAPVLLVQSGFRQAQACQGSLQCLSHIVRCESPGQGEVLGCDLNVHGFLVPSLLHVLPDELLRLRMHARADTNPWRV